MNSDTVLFHEICQLFDELDHITSPATSKRISPTSDTGSSYYLTKEVKKQVHQAISKWFAKFDGGNLLALFRLLVPEVHKIFSISVLTFMYIGRYWEGLFYQRKAFSSILGSSARIRELFSCR